MSPKISKNLMLSCKDSCQHDPSVSTEEALCASRHLSVAAQRPYMTLDGISEASRFKALGIKSKKGGKQASIS